MFAKVSTDLLISWVGNWLLSAWCFFLLWSGIDRYSVSFTIEAQTGFACLPGLCAGTGGISGHYSLLARCINSTRVYLSPIPPILRNYSPLIPVFQGETWNSHLILSSFPCFQFWQAETHCGPFRLSFFPSTPFRFLPTSLFHYIFRWYLCLPVCHPPVTPSYDEGIGDLTESVKG